MRYSKQQGNVIHTEEKNQATETATQVTEMIKFEGKDVKTVAIMIRKCLKKSISIIRR